MVKVSGDAKHARCSLRLSKAMTISGDTWPNTANPAGAIMGYAKLMPGSDSVTFTAHSGTLASSTSKLHFVILSR